MIAAQGGEGCKGVARRRIILTTLVAAFIALAVVTTRTAFPGTAGSMADQISSPVYAKRQAPVPNGRSVDVMAAASPTPIPAADHLTYGNSVKGSFAAGTDIFTYHFDAQSGDVITLTMIADRNQPLDPALVLIGPDGGVVAQNDDSFDTNFGPLNARLVNFPIADSGTYTIQAERGSDTDGNFILTLRGSRGRNADTTIGYGQGAQGSISAQSVRTSYRFAATQGDVISIVVQSAPGSTLIPYLQLLAQNGDKLTSTNPAERTAKVARITRFPIQVDGQYTIVVSRTGEERGTSSGAFSLMLTRDASYPVVNYGDTTSGTIGSQQFEITYLFNATAGDVIMITMVRTSGTLDAMLNLLGADGTLLASNDNNTGSGLRKGDAQIKDFKIATTGAYTIVAGRKDKAKGKTTGDFSLSLDMTKPVQRTS